MNFILGVILIYAFYELWCPNKNCPSKSNQFTFGKYTVHIHHWIIHLLLLFSFKYLLMDLTQNYGKYNDFILGILFGGILHGLLEYNDSFRIIYS